MSAVDEYRASELWNVTLPEETGEGTLYRPGVPVVRKSLADDAIAELEAQVAQAGETVLAFSRAKRAAEEWALERERLLRAKEERIAELEAEVKEHIEREYEQRQRARKAEAELAALKEEARDTTVTPRQC